MEPDYPRFERFGAFMESLPAPLFITVCLIGYGLMWAVAVGVFVVIATVLGLELGV